MNIDEFLLKINRKPEDFKVSKVKLLQTMQFSNKRIDSLIETINQFDDSKTSEKYIKEILRKPSNENGKIYEILGYRWLYDHYVKFDLQPNLKKEECLKDNAESYDADGQIENIIFDIKAFGFGMPRYVEFSNKLNQLIDENKLIKVSDFIGSIDSDDNERKDNNPTITNAVLGDYYITVSGKADLSSDDFEGKLNGREPDILKKLFAQKTNYTDYTYNIESIELRAHFKKKFMSTISSFNTEEWAMNNQYQLLKHGSQFSRYNPFIIICAYDDYRCNRLFGTQDKQYAFRSLCRRMFMFHTKMEEKKLSDFDGKADKNISVAAAAKKLSGVLFLDVSDNPDKHGDLFFINPNADFPLYSYQIDAFFRCNGVIVEDYKYDNY